MATRLKSGRDWKETIRLNGTAELNDNEPTHKVIAARINKCIREGNYDEIANLQAVIGAFNTVDGRLTETVQVYTFANSAGKEFNVPREDLKEFMANKDFTLIGSETIERNV
jgi:hypothetical protein